MTNKCKSPWTGIFVEQNGRVKSCCAGSYYWGDLNTQTIEEIINGETAQNIRKELAADQPSEYCARCRRDEIRTGYSLRGFYDQFTVTEEQLADPRVTIFRSLDIRWNALCNLSCIYCSEYNSTKWQKLKGIPIELTERSYYNNLLDYVKAHQQELESLMLVGGEPLLQKQNVRLLKDIPPDVPVNIISNLSVDLDTNLVFKELINKNNVLWNVSAENVDSRFNYVRYGAEWGQLFNNLKHIRPLPGQSLSLLSVYCIYSATNMVELYEVASELNIQLHWQNLWEPDWQNVVNFGPSVRARAKEEINKVLSLPYINKFDSGKNRLFLATMLSQLEMPLPKKYCNQTFLTQTLEYESKYTNNVFKFADLWPELYQLIKNDL